MSNDNNDLHDFEQFMKRRADAARAYVRGDATPPGASLGATPRRPFLAPRAGIARGRMRCGQHTHMMPRYSRPAATVASRSCKW